MVDYNLFRVSHLEILDTIYLLLSKQNTFNDFIYKTVFHCRICRGTLHFNVIAVF
jgi:hypothetical protein